jgi:hypothetical protein
VIYASRTASAVGRGGQHQLSPTFPRSPGIIPAVLSAASFRPLRCDCSIKERAERAEPARSLKLLFSTTFSPSETVNKLGVNWLTGYSPAARMAWAVDGRALGTKKPILSPAREGLKQRLER